MLKTKLKRSNHPPENFLTIGGCFECNTSCVKGARLAGEEEDDNDEQFRVSTVSGLPL